ncbi:LOW QUALITY PROTEIN: cytochrome P450 2W1-like [Phaethornis superciliosus]
MTQESDGTASEESVGHIVPRASLLLPCTQLQHQEGNLEKGLLPKPAGTGLYDPLTILCPNSKGERTGRVPWAAPMGGEAVKDGCPSEQSVFGGSPTILIFCHIQHGNGVFFSSQELWKMTHSHHVTFHRGKHLGEERMLEELHFLIKLIKSFKGGPFQLWIFNIAPNFSFAILSRKFDDEDPILLSLLRLTDEVMNLLDSPFTSLFNFYSFLGFLLKPHNMILKKKEACVIFKKCIKKSKERLEDHGAIHEVQRVVTLLPQVPQCTSPDTHFFKLHPQDLCCSPDEEEGAAHQQPTGA